VRFIHFKELDRLSRTIFWWVSNWWGKNFRQSLNVPLDVIIFINIKRDRILGISYKCMPADFSYLWRRVLGRYCSWILYSSVIPNFYICLVFWFHSMFLIAWSVFIEILDAFRRTVDVICRIYHLGRYTQFVWLATHWRNPLPWVFIQGVLAMHTQIFCYTKIKNKIFGSKKRLNNFDNCTLLY
jgi:hypothetical protein